MQYTLPDGYSEALVRRGSVNDPDALIKALEAGRGPITIRINTKKWSPSSEALEAHFGVQMTPVPWAEHAYFLESRYEVADDPLWYAGAYYVQGATSMLLEQFIDAVDVARALDMCAAPGGKALHMADLLADDAFVVANEMVAKRRSVLAENVARWGRYNIAVTGARAEDFAAAPMQYDLISVDAPCSGEGMFAKSRTAREAWSEALCVENVARQREILAHAIEALAPGGQLLYATCTFNPAENEENIAWILEAFPMMTLAPVDGLETYGAVAVTIGIESVAAWYCYPHRMRGGGMFFARLQKEGSRPHKKPHGHTDDAVAESYRALMPVGQLRTRGAHVIAAHSEVAMLEDMRVAKRGIMCGKVTAGTVRPDHELALSSDLVPPHTVSVTREEALHFMTKTWAPAVQDVPDGWCLVAHQDVGIGWVKVRAGRAKNYFPIQKRRL